MSEHPEPYGCGPAASVCGHICRTGTTAWRGSIVPEAASGRIGV
jgi:hypothetical protein